MSNPFGDEFDDDNEILEGFICPICREDLKSLEFLISHFEKQHPEDDDLKRTFREIFSKAKKKIKSNFEETFDLSRNLERNASISSSRSGGSSTNAVNASRDTSNTRSRMNCFNFMDYQEVGKEQQHMEFFQSIRNPRLERYASETNKLIIRLHKLLKDMPTDTVLRKQHEQNIVPWLDGSSVKLCPNCAKSFNITRRKHHCRLCGSIMCHDCSKFLSIEVALDLASLTMAQSEPLKTTNEKSASASAPQQEGIRSCDHCLWLLETRQEMQESRTSRPPITQIYHDIQQFRKNVMPDIEMYLKIINSLYEGESIFTLNDASALRGRIGQVAEVIDLLSKRILAIPCDPGTREESLKKSIRLSCIQLIKENMLTLPPLPKEDEIREIRERKRMETEMRIATERRKAMEAYEKYGLASSDNTSDAQSISVSGDYAQGMDFHSLDNWTALQIRNENLVQSDDPLVEQINIIKGYIKQARQDMNFDVVETLEMNLRELQKEFYERQRSLSKAANTPTEETNYPIPTNETAK